MGELFSGQLLRIMRDARPPRVNDVEKKTLLPIQQPDARQQEL